MTFLPRGTGFDLERLGLTAADLERAGAGVVIDEIGNNGDRLLAWTDNRTAFLPQAPRPRLVEHLAHEPGRSRSHSLRCARPWITPQSDPESRGTRGASERILESQRRPGYPAHDRSATLRPKPTRRYCAVDSFRRPINTVSKWL